jgi:osmoprotectant transport system permease protein
MIRPVLLLLCLASSVAAQTLTVGSKSFTESVLLGEILCQLLEARGHPATHRADLGGSQILFKGLQSGQIDLYVEYTGTIAQELLARHRPQNDADLRRLLAEQKIGMSEHLGFINNYALGMSRSVATMRNISSIADLRSHPDLRFALSNEFLGRKDGWPLLAQRYELPQSPSGMTHETALAGLVRGQSEVTDLYTTDPEITQYDLVTLEDSLGVLPLYHAVLLYRADLPEEVVAVLRSLEGKISTEEMAKLNATVSINRVSEKQAAAEFLHEKFGVEIRIAESRMQRLLKGVLIATYEHMLLVLVSLACAILLAIPLGILAYRYASLGGLILGTVGVIQTIPSMALLVALIPLLGLNQKPALAALLLYSLLPIVRNTYQGLQDIEPSLRESAEVLGLSSLAKLTRVELPLASRNILAGIKTAAVINVGTATIGALIGAGGYGQLILTGIRLDDWVLILCGAVPAALLALAMQGFFSVIEPLVVPRGLRLQR